MGLVGRLGQRGANKRGFPEPEHRCCPRFSSRFGQPISFPARIRPCPRGAQGPAQHHEAGGRGGLGLALCWGTWDGWGHSQIALALGLACRVPPCAPTNAFLPGCGVAWCNPNGWQRCGCDQGGAREHLRQRCRGSHHLQGIDAHPLGSWVARGAGGGTHVLPAQHVPGSASLTEVLFPRVQLPNHGITGKCQNPCHGVTRPRAGQGPGARVAVPTWCCAAVPCWAGLGAIRVAGKEAFPSPTLALGQAPK